MRNLVDFTDLTNALGPSAKARTAMRKALKRVGTYPVEELRGLVRYVVATEGVREENVLFANGSTRIVILLLDLLKPGSIAIPDPVPLHLTAIFKERRIDLVRIPADASNGFLPRPETLIESVSRAGLLLIPSPHPITGALIQAELQSAVVASAAGAGSMVVFDEALRSFCAEQPPTPAVTENSVVLRSFSLFHALAGLRLGYALAPHGLVANLRRLVEPFCINSLAPAAARASLRDKAYRKRSLNYVGQEKAYLKQKVGKLQGVTPMDTSCNLLLLRLEGKEPGLTDRFLERNILVTSFADEQGSLWLRVPIRRHKENALFVGILGKLLKSGPRG